MAVYKEGTREYEDFKGERQNKIERIKALYESGYNVVEIASVIDLPESTVQQMLHSGNS